MRCEHFPLFTHGIHKSQSECPASRQISFFIGGGGGECQQPLVQLLVLRIRKVHGTGTRVVPPHNGKRGK